MPPAAPQATSSRSRARATAATWPSVEPSAEPICTIGPSRPTEPPEPMQRAEASDLTTATAGRMRPPARATASITSGTPWPRPRGRSGRSAARRAGRRRSGPATTNQMPEAGDQRVGRTCPCGAVVGVAGEEVGEAARSGSGRRSRPGRRRRRPRGPGRAGRSGPPPNRRSGSRPATGGGGSRCVLPSRRGHAAIPSSSSSIARRMFSQRKAVGSMRRRAASARRRSASSSEARALAGTVANLPAFHPLFDPAAQVDAAAGRRWRAKCSRKVGSPSTSAQMSARTWARASSACSSIAPRRSGAVARPPRRSLSADSLPHRSRQAVSRQAAPPAARPCSSKYP